MMVMYDDNVIVGYDISRSGLPYVPFHIKLDNNRKEI